MARHPQREQAIRRCLEQGEPPAQVAAELGVAASTLRGWLRLGRLERELAALRQERDGQQQRQEQQVHDHCEVRGCVGCECCSGWRCW